MHSPQNLKSFRDLKYLFLGLPHFSHKYYHNLTFRIDVFLSESLKAGFSAENAKNLKQIQDLLSL